MSSYDGALCYKNERGVVYLIVEAVFIPRLQYVRAIFVRLFYEHI